MFSQTIFHWYIAKAKGLRLICQNLILIATSIEIMNIAAINTNLCSGLWRLAF